MADQVKYGQKLKGKKVLIIGGTSGIGFATAEAFVEQGSTVTVASSRQERVDHAISRLTKAYPSATSRVSGLTVDLGSEATLESNIIAFLDKVGQLDHLIYTAGDSLNAGTFTDQTLETIKKGGMVRFFAPLLIGKHAKKYLKDSYESSYTLTGGATAEKPAAGFAAITPYAGSIHSMAKALAVELAPIRVNAVSPGGVDTELWDQLTQEHRDHLHATISDAMLTKKLPGPEEIAEAYVYLARDYNVTGSYICSNGGSIIK